MLGVQLAYAARAAARPTILQLLVALARQLTDLVVALHVAVTLVVVALRALALLLEFALELTCACALRLQVLDDAVGDARRHADDVGASRYVGRDAAKKREHEREVIQSKPNYQ